MLIANLFITHFYIEMIKHESKLPASHAEDVLLTICNSYELTLDFFVYSVPVLSEVIKPTC